MKKQPKYYQMRVSLIINIKQVQCNICYKTYANIYLLKSHIKTVHGRNSQYKCLIPWCEKEFKSFYRLYEHDLTHQGLKQNNNFNFFYSKVKGILNPEEKINLKDELLNCNLCPYKCHKISDILTHYNYVHKLEKK